MTNVKMVVHAAMKGDPKDTEGSHMFSFLQSFSERRDINVTETPNGTMIIRMTMEQITLRKGSEK
jgi:hypothetical protein